MCKAEVQSRYNAGAKQVQKQSRCKAVVKPRLEHDGRVEDEGAVHGRRDGEAQHAAPGVKRIGRKRGCGTGSEIDSESARCKMGEPGVKWV